MTSLPQSSDAEFEDGRNGSMVVKLAKANAPSC